MKNHLNSEKGFTLIELVMVIVILGILAAVAIPRFVDLQGSARNSVAHGFTGAIAGQITMLHARKLITPNATNTYNETLILGSIDTSGVDAFAAGAGTFTALVNRVTYNWTYTANDGATATGVRAAKIDENTTTGGFVP